MRSILPAFRNRLLLRLGLFLAQVALTGCSYAQQRSDGHLEERISHALMASDELNLSRIDVNVEPEVVYLSGMADDHESKVHAEQKARALAKDRRIINKIEVDF